ncbi:pickpocket protein 28 [Nomia melanderi]|uniref:pickpocket protein 28 n=1 Tax=Nomia melanderi TaxID=2448451 RepID=UPI001303FCC6|nr:pickpocket protein 28-like [Nomia melanderi]
MKYNYTPSLRELRSSVKRRSKEYFLENSLHGVPYAADPTRPKWERITWFFLTVASVVATVITIAIIWGKFQTEPTITGLDVLTEDAYIDFPRIFVCFDWSQLNYMQLNKDEIRMYEQLYNWRWGKDLDSKMYDTVYQKKKDFSADFETMAPNCGDVMTNCNYKGLNKSCSTLFTKAVVAVGACCKLNTLDPVGIKDAIRELEFEIKSSYYPWRLYITQNIDSSPIPEERPLVKAYFPIDIEFSVEMTYVTSDIHYLSLRQRKCNYKHDESFTNCEIKYFTNQLLTHCKCVPWFLAFIKKEECKLSKYSCLNYTTVDISDSNCWLSCDHTSYSVKAILKSYKNSNRIIFKFWPVAFYKREMRFGYLDLLVSFGGIASLFLGYSLLTSVELGYYFSLRSYCGAVIQSSRQKYNIRTIHVVEKVPNKINIQQRYHQYID